VLAGGRARRMGGADKGLVRLAGRAMVARIAEALRPQVGTLLVNANRNLDAYGRAAGCPVLPDAVGDFAGPLAGMASGMLAAATPWLLTVPCDSPLVAPTLCERLLAPVADGAARIAVATDGARLQPVFAMLSCDLLEDLLAALEAGERKIDRWYARHAVIEVAFADHPQMFLNVNTPEDHARMEQRLRDEAAT